MLRRVLEFGSYLDWLTPLVAFVKDWINRPSHTFLIPENCGWSALDVQRVLRRHGIRTWGLMIVKSSILISMRLAQAHWAQYLLEREGIPIEYGRLSGRPEPAAGGYRPRSRADAARTRAPRGIWADLSEALNAVLRELRDLLGL
jgi:hypothetical protein